MQDSLEEIPRSDLDALLAEKKGPRHIAIIPDGNRRWARRNKTNIPDGHRSGVDILMEVLLAAKAFHVRILTFYGFSTENWLRNDEEIEALFAIMDAYLNANLEEMVKEEIRFFAIGDLMRVPEFLQNTIQEAMHATDKGEKIDFVCAINYGSRDEIVRACKKMAQKVGKGELQVDAIDGNLFKDHLDTALWPDPDLLIRTSGEFRLSNFLLWQLSYSELFITQKLWPEFRREDLLEAIQFYLTRDRRMGGA